MVKKLMKNKKKRLSKEQIVENKNRASFKKQIKDIFILSGFNPLNVQGFQFELGNRPNELDHCFIYENIIIICEDTIKFLKKKDLAATNGESFNRNHKLEKNESAHIILTNKERFIGILKQKFPDVEQIKIYNPKEFRIFYLYFEYGKQHISSEDENRYSYLKFIDYPTLNYLSIMSKSLKASFKYEIFRFLNLSRTDIGKPDPFGNNIKPIISSIIYPDSVTGFNNGIRMVSFMMRPSDLIENSFVLRKDGWEQNVDLYQRLITPKRIKSIRDFVVNNKTTFLNNIIVTLPPNVEFYKKENGKRLPVNIDDITNYSNNVEICIPVDFNSMAIIDGQHRVYAYYQDNENNISEQVIAKLRNELNLLVTGIIYPNNDKYDDPLERRKFESNLFVSINKNAKPVDADTLIQVQAIMNPTSGEAISRKVIERLNKEEPFTNMFQLSKVETAPIKIASIIQYALSSLLVAKNNDNSLYRYWLVENKLNDDYVLRSSEDIKDYINYCVKYLKEYFKAIKSKFNSFWNKDSKLLMVISLNAFIIAFRETLKMCNGPQKYNFYSSVFKDWDFSFENSKDKNKQFPYAGAQYSKFAKNEIIPLFVRNYNTTK